MGIKQSKEELEVFKQKAMQAYAKANKISILIFIRESYSHELVAVSVQERTDYKGDPYYTFGRLYHVFGEQCTYDQCGCATFDDEMKVRMAAYQFFGIK